MSGSGKNQRREKGRRTIQGFLIAAVILTLGACSQLKDAPRNQTTSNMEVAGSVSLPSGECSRGLFIFDAFKNYATGKVQIVGRGFMTKKPLTKEYDPYVILGIVPLSRKERMKKGVDYGKVPFMDLGHSVTVQLGEDPAPPSAKVIGQMTKAQIVEEVRPVETEASETASITLMSRPDHKVYYSDFENPLKFEIDEPGEGRAATYLAGGVGRVRSFVLANRQVGVGAFSVPNDLESPESRFDVDVSGTIGTPLTLRVEPDPDIPEGAKAFITVEVVERTRSGKPGWRAIFRQPDDGSSEIQIPTKWGKGEGMNPGPVWITLKRSYLIESPLSDAVGGQVCIETGAGIVTAGTLEKPDASK